MADNARDSRELEKARDRITDWGIGRIVDDHIATLQSNPKTDKKLFRNSEIAKALMDRADVVALIGKATIRPIDIQVYLVQRRKRQEENADRLMTTGAHGKVLMTEIAKRVETIIEMVATLELAFPHVSEANRSLIEAVNNAAKKGDFSNVKDLKAMTTVMKNYQDMMFNTAQLIKGDATLQNIIKAQHMAIKHTVIQGIQPQDVPEMIIGAMTHMKCGNCGNKDWKVQDAMGAFAKFKSTEAGRNILEAEQAPLVADLDPMDDPDGAYWDGEYESRK